MALVKDYEIARVEVDPATADVGLLLNLLVVDNGIVAFSNNHRFRIPAAMTLPEVQTLVNSVLTDDDYPALAAADVTSLTATINAARANLGKPKIPRAPPFPGPPPVLP